MTPAREMVSFDFARLRLEEVEAAAAAHGGRHKFGISELSDPDTLPHYLERFDRLEPLIGLVWGSAVGLNVVERLGRIKRRQLTCCVVALNYRLWIGKVVPPSEVGDALEMAKAAAQTRPEVYSVTELPWERRRARHVFEGRLPIIGEHEYAYIDVPCGSIIELQEHLNPLE